MSFLNIKSGQFSCLVSRSSILEQTSVLHVEKMWQDSTGKPIKLEGTQTRKLDDIPIKTIQMMLPCLKQQVGLGTKERWR